MLAGLAMDTIRRDIVCRNMWQVDVPMFPSSQLNREELFQRLPGAAGGPSPIKVETSLLEMRERNARNSEKGAFTDGSDSA